MEISSSHIRPILMYGFMCFRNWQLCVNDFTDLLKQEPMNAAARIYRGRAFSKMKMWNEAVEDLSAGIHLNPTSGEAFYYRGCILRKLVCLSFQLLKVKQENFNDVKITCRARQ